MLFPLFLACLADPVDYETYLNEVEFYTDTGPVVAGRCSEPTGEPRTVSFTNRTDQAIAIEWVGTDCGVEPWTGLMFIDTTQTRIAQPGEVYRIMSASTLIDFVPTLLDERVLEDVDTVEVTL